MDNKSTETNRFLETVEKTIRRYRMFHNGDFVLVGVSGGPDSVALLHVLMTLAPKWSIRLAVAHLNHGLRGEESKRDADFTAALADTHGLPFHSTKMDANEFRKHNRLSLEDAGRRLRYDFYEEVAETHGYQKIALGHNADDSAENVLMFLLRGSGPLGVSGIAPVRDDKFVRPLIETTRAEIMAFLTGNGFKYVSDSTNRDMRYLRNKIRHKLIPHLKATYNPRIIETLNRMSKILQEEEAWFDETIQPIIKDAVLASGKNRVSLSIPKLNNHHTAVQRRLLRHAIENVKGDLRKITYAHIEKMIALCSSGPKSGRLDFPDQIRIDRDDAVLSVSKHTIPLRQLNSSKRSGAAHIFTYEIPEPEKRRPQVLWIDELGGHLKLTEISTKKLPSDWNAGQNVAFFDMNKIHFPLTIRNIEPGDRFSPLGMKGTQKIKDFFINNKVPIAERIKCAVMVSEGKIVWVMGYRIDDSVKVTPLAQKLLKAEVLLA